ncbi:MAG: hypothetical protein KGL39_42120 [Patescibacteria group bacterium]|nr:hypothetical protein [Patescibacteria group bacterium]
MSKIERTYRQANVTAGKAIQELQAAYPNAEIQEFEPRVLQGAEARAQRVAPGTKMFVATLKFAEDEEGGSEPPEPKAESSEPKESPEPAFEGGDEGDEPEADKPPKPKSEGESKDKIGEEGADDGPEHKMKPEEEMVHLLKQILDAVRGDELGGPDDLGLGPKPGPAGPPPSAHAGPPGPPPGPGGHGGPPLPPPVEKEAPGMAFAHYNPTAASFAVIRREANELGHRGLIAEAENVYPTHRVARLVTQGIAEIDGYKVDLASNNIAVLRLDKR